VSSRGRCARALAEHLTDQTGTPVAVVWDNPSARPGHGTWRVEWTDGPTTTAMRALATDHARWVAPLNVTTLRWSRQYTARAWAAALLTRADHDTLPDTPTQAVALVEYDLHDTDTTTWSSSTTHAATNLARRADASPLRMATMLLTERRNENTAGHHHNTATPSADEYRYNPPPAPGPCPNHPGCAIARCHRFRCDKPIHILNQPGRPRRFCSPACRVAEHRRLHQQPHTNPTRPRPTRTRPRPLT
jgi:hypothetical protein